MDVAKISFKNTFIYRWSALFTIISSITMTVISVSLWRYLYREDIAMIAYMTKYVIIANLLSIIYRQNVAQRLAGKFSTGAFVFELLRPINAIFFHWKMELGEVWSNIILKCVPVMLIFMPALLSSYSNVLVAISFVILGYLLNILLFTFIGIISFAVLEIWPFQMCIESCVRLLSGMFIPLPILPVSLRAIARYLPFRFMYSVPLELLCDTYVGHIVQDYVVIFAYLLIFTTLNCFAYRIALRVMSIQGG